MTKLTLPVLCLLAATHAVQADDVSDAISSASSAYGAGDLPGTSAQLIAASKALMVLQTQRLAQHLPAPPSGWTHEVEAQDREGMALMGLIGNMAKARYQTQSEGGFNLTFTADSPLVMQMAGILGNPQMMAMMGKLVKVNGQDMMQQGNQLSALVGGRVLIQADGMPPDKMQEVLSQIDFTKLAKYDS